MDDLSTIERTEDLVASTARPHAKKRCDTARADWHPMPVRTQFLAGQFKRAYTDALETAI